MFFTGQNEKDPVVQMTEKKILELAKRHDIMQNRKRLTKSEALQGACQGRRGLAIGLPEPCISDCLCSRNAELLTWHRLALTGLRVMELSLLE